MKNQENEIESTVDEEIIGGFCVYGKYHRIKDLFETYEFDVHECPGLLELDRGYERGFSDGKAAGERSERARHVPVLRSRELSLTDGFSVRSVNTLRRGGCVSLGDLADYEDLAENPPKHFNLQCCLNTAEALERLCSDLQISSKTYLEIGEEQRVLAEKLALRADSLRKVYENGQDVRKE